MSDVSHAAALTEDSAHAPEAFARPALQAVICRRRGRQRQYAGSVGSILMRNLLGNPFGGVVYPVNPKRKAVHGVFCYPSLMDLPEAVDLAVIATPAARCRQPFEQCVAARRAGSDHHFGRLLRTRRRRAGAGTAKSATWPCGKMRIHRAELPGHYSPVGGLERQFRGGDGQARAGGAAEPERGDLHRRSSTGPVKHMSVSAPSSASAPCSTSISPICIDYFGDDPNTRSIVLYMESVGDVRKFFSAARAVARAKQVIVVKAGRHEAGANAAASHTGALAGSDAVFDAAIRRAGVLRVTTIPDLFNMAEILGHQPPPRGPALAIITNAGGPGVMATDALMLGGGQLAALSAETLDALNKVLPPFWSHGNPVDVLGDATPERYRQGGRDLRGRSGRARVAGPADAAGDDRPD